MNRFTPPRLTAAAVVLAFAVVTLSLWTTSDVSAQTTSFEVTARPYPATPGQTVDVVVRGWDTGEVDIHWNDSSCSGSSEIAILPQSSVREFRGTFTVPQSAAPGTYRLYLYVHGYSPPCRLVFDQFKVVAPATPLKPPTETIAPPTPTEKPSCPETDNLKLPETKSSDVLVVLVHGWNSGPDRWDDLSLALGRAKLAGTVKADVAILDWHKAAAASDPNTGGAISLNLGNPDAFWVGPKLDAALRVGRCLGDALLTSGYSSFHLIGHSLGSWVIDAAADKLTPEGKKTHLTFLDAYVPDGAANRDELGNKATFAEQFVSRLFGTPSLTAEQLPQVYNFDVTDSRMLGSAAKAFFALTSKPIWVLAQKKEREAVSHDFFQEHGWPIGAYTERVKNNKALGWEFGRPPSQDTYQKNQMACARVVPGECPTGEYTLPVLTTRELDLGDSGLDMSLLKGATRTGAGLGLKTQSPASALITTSEVAAVIEVDLTAVMTGSGKGTLTFVVNGGEPLTAEFGTEGLSGTVWLLLDQQQGVKSIGVTLDTVGQGQATAEIKKLRFVSSASSGAQDGPIASVTPKPPATGGGPGAGSTDDGIPWAAGALAFAAVLTGIGVTGARLRNRR